MHYEGSLLRPPNEADSILLQVTVGCSYNRCAFCAAYKEKRFRIKETKLIDADLEDAAQHYPDKERLFFCDGDALILPQERLVELFMRIHERLPRVKRISMYANARSIARKNSNELRQLKTLGLSMIHMGLESGDDITLKSVEKWGSSREIIAQGKKVRNAGIKLFVTVILGLGGVERSEVHAVATGEALSEMNPPYVGALSYMPVEGTVLCDRLTAGTFVLPDARQMLCELRTMLAHTDLRPGMFYANHASNYLPLKIRLPREKLHALSLIDCALRGDIPLTPEWLRGL
ncbi:MAG: radical SAM protein [Chitinispirillaceae bacterium]|nr:radical SAM protein [Chitinispirillaceae bacterium]